MTPNHNLANAGAVPGTGNRGARTYRFIRRPRNAAVKRALAACGGLRGEKVPPSSWDDIPRRPERSWKAHRRYRWRDRTGSQEA
jgi:hypothetical protein